MGLSSASESEKYEATGYECAVKNGGTLLSVHCDTSEQITAAKVASKETSAHDISSANEAGTEDKKGGRGIYGNIADGEPVISKTEMRIWF